MGNSNTSSADYETMATGAARAALSLMRGQERTSALLDRVVDTLHELAHAVNDQLQRNGDPERRHLPVCKEGCGWCCHTDVVVGPAEILRIARHLEATRSAADLAALRARLAELTERTRELTVAEWKTARIPCPLLDTTTSSCTVHGVRPAACRAHNSLDLDRCVRQYETGDERNEIVLNDVQRRSILATAIGLAAALRAYDMEWQGVSLTAGLALALQDESALSDWLAGKAPFQSAQTKTSRKLLPYNTADVERTTVRLRSAHATELPSRPVASEDEARRVRNKKKRERKGR